MANRLTSDPTIGIQVKARHGSIDTVKWWISQEEAEQNAVLVCILIQEEVDEAQPKYNLILTGFLPTTMIELTNGKASIVIDKLLYGGALQSYLTFIGLISRKRTEGKPFCYPGILHQSRNCFL